jgi:quinol-cytochrome oxidoreductase complex cytochrome b subunit
MHRWTASLMVMFLVLHVFRVYLTGGFKKPREFTWLTGIVLAVITASFPVLLSGFVWHQSDLDRGQINAVGVHWQGAGLECHLDTLSVTWVVMVTLGVVIRYRPAEAIVRYLAELTESQSLVEGWLPLVGTIFFVHPC